MPVNIRAMAFSTNGCRTAIRLKESLRGEDVSIFCKTSSDNAGVERIQGSAKEWTGRAFSECDAIVFIGAVGIAVRYIAPFIKSKDTDPAVVCMDEHGRYAIALLSGHIGGCNDLTERIAAAMGSTPIITTATDLNGKFSVDSFAVANGLRIGSLKTAKDTSARVLDGRFVGFLSEIPVEGEPSPGLTEADSGEFGVCISYDPERRPFDTTMSLTPMDIIVGVGCRRDTDPREMDSFVRRVLSEEGIRPERVCAVASIDIKSDEDAIIALGRSLDAPVRFFTSEELMSVEGEFSSSEFVKGITSVDCVCERAAMAVHGGEMIRRKVPESGMTMALCRRAMEPRFLK